MIRATSVIRALLLVAAVGSSSCSEPGSVRSSLTPGPTQSTHSACDCCTREDVKSVYGKDGKDPFCNPALAHVDYTPNEWFDEEPFETDQADIWIGPPEGIKNWRPTLWDEVREDLFFDDTIDHALPSEFVVDFTTEGVPIDRDDPPDQEPNCTEAWWFHPSLYEWTLYQSLPPGDPHDGICECAEYVAAANSLLALAMPPADGHHMDPRPTTVGRGVPPPGTRARSFRAFARAYTQVGREQLRGTQRYRALNQARSDWLQGEYFRNGTQPARKVVVVGMGPAGATVLANVSGDLNPRRGFTVVGMGLRSHFEHMANFETGQEVIRFAVPASMADDRALHPETYRAMFPASRRTYLPYGTVMAVVERIQATMGPGGDNQGVFDQHGGRVYRLERLPSGKYVARYRYQGNARTALQEGEFIILATGNGLPRELADSVIRVDGMGAEAQAQRRTVRRSIKTIETLFSRANDNYLESFDEGGVRRPPTRGDRTPLEQQVDYYRGKKVLVFGGGASGLMALDLLHFVMPEAAANGGDPSNLRPELVFAYRGDRISAVSGDVRSLVGRRGQYRRVYELMRGSDPTIEDLPLGEGGTVTRVEPVSARGRQRLRVTFSDGSQRTVDEIVTAIGQVTDVDRVIGPDLLQRIRPLTHNGQIVGLWDEGGLVVVGIGANALAGRLLSPDYAAPPPPAVDQYAQARRAATDYRRALDARVTAVRRSTEAHEGPNAANTGSLAVHGPMIQGAVEELRDRGFRVPNP